MIKYEQLNINLIQHKYDKILFISVKIMK